ncbi:hypothetical protein GCM10012286_07520 [Streptomyces lasiicapitis]|uniref:Uncharacterized protein n=1 Tax=Streptomyces lasiicapitis TaxID=1923961 RepID=A0ABQ2LJK3_9ACTN|nr:hypothetical protein GCM10012286_07520 [Streptomyces lasiicapitis]
MPGTAVPMGTRGAGASGATVAAHVVSVGPYAFMTARPGAQREMRSGGQASPARDRTRRSVNVSAASAGSVPTTDGGRVACVMCCWASVRASSSPTRRCWWGSTRVAPVVRAMIRSQTDTSKLGDADCRTREPGARSKRSRWTARRAAMPVWVTVTPLGRPVEPEV